MSSSSKQRDELPEGLSENDTELQYPPFMSHRFPAFQSDEPTEWFNYMDNFFVKHGIVTDNTKINFVLVALDENATRSVAKLLGPSASYDAIRKCLIEAPVNLRPAVDVLPGTSTACRPSQLLANLRTALPENVDQETILDYWLMKLPSNIFSAVVSLDGEIDELAHRADIIFEAGLPHAFDFGKRLTMLEEAVQSLKLQFQAFRALFEDPRKPSPLAQPQDAAIATPPEMCYYHTRYGRKARRCKYPCIYKVTESDSNAGPSPAGN
ncbi:Hypothetical protein CINCED_3A013673 [Cinara cedri]|uniref:DUF7041 domain-containing protein n=1 Tax=Cinara cedri TaxID=506608 RepID=A0A5E4NA78_9HEMI|nr:Hypothetical protein CINCED_3A013673 [Cinara cedri]